MIPILIPKISNSQLRSPMTSWLWVTGCYVQASDSKREAEESGPERHPAALETSQLERGRPSVDHLDVDGAWMCLAMVNDA